MKGARFTIPTPALLAKVVDLLADIPMEDRDTKGDLYEYMLSKIASAGQNGQFRTPRHIIALMVEMMAPGPKDVICDPACGTCGFLVAAGEYLRDNHPKLFHDKASRDHFHEEMFHGFDFDGTMLRIGSMNMMLHGVENPDIRYKDSLAQEHAGDADRYSLVLANPPFAGSLDYETTAKDLLAIVKTKKTELLFMALFLKLLKPGGRAAVIVPDGVLFGSSTAHKAIRKHAGGGSQARRHRQAAVRRVPALCGRLDRDRAVHQDQFRRHGSRLVLRLPGGRVFARRQAQSAAAGRRSIGPTGASSLTTTSTRRTICPTSPRAGRSGRAAERERPRTEQSFCVPKAEIAAADYDLSINRYKEVVHASAEHRPPKEIMAELKALEQEIAEGLDELETML